MKYYRVQGIEHLIGYLVFDSIDDDNLEDDLKSMILYRVPMDFHIYALDESIDISDYKDIFDHMLLPISLTSGMGRPIRPCRREPTPTMDADEGEVRIESASD